ncbi:MAG: diguanylate cyclase [bacterium]
MNKKKISLKFKFSIIISGLICMIMISVGLITIEQVKRPLIEEMKKKGEALASNIAANCEEALLTGDELLLGVYMDKAIEEKSVIYAMVLDNEGGVISHSDHTVVKGTVYNDPIGLKAKAAERMLIQHNFTKILGNYYDIATPILTKGQRLATLRIGFSGKEIHLAVARMQRIISGVTAGVLLLGLVVAWFLVSFITGPLAKLIRGVKNVSAGDLKHRIVLKSRDEIGELADSFNNMTKDLLKNQQALSQKVLDLETLQKLSTSISSVLEKEELLRLIVSLYVDMAKVKKVSLMLTDENANELRIQAAEGIDREKFERIKFKIGEGVAGKAAESGKVICLDDVRKFSDYKVFNPTGEKIRESLLVMPLTVKEKVLGVINLSNKLSGEPFTKDEVTLYSTLANHVAVTIENAILYELAITDGLTQLYIPRYFQFRLKEEIERTQRYGQPLSLLMIDIDHFKSVNDLYGHQTGDEVLKMIAKKLKEKIRSFDIAARYGGEEFAIITPEMDSQGAAIFAERIRTIIEETEFNGLGNMPLKVTISVGTASYTKKDIEEKISRKVFIKRADQALYRAKKQGRNQVCNYSGVS